VPATAKPLLRGASPSGYGSALRGDEYRRRLNAAGNFSNVSSTAPDKGGLCGKPTGLSNAQRAKFHSKVLIAPKENRKNEIFFIPFAARTWLKTASTKNHFFRLKRADPSNYGSADYGCR
jgi:hypothetical protein